MVWAARLLRRPVKWTATRTEHFSPTRKRADHDTPVAWGSIATGASWRCRSIRWRRSAAISATLPQHSRQFVSADRHRPLQDAQSPSAGARRVHQHRAGRRLSRLGPAGGDLDQRAPDRGGARELGIDVVEMRRRNLIARADSVSRAGRTRIRFRRSAGTARSAVAAADYAALRREQGRLRSRGVLMGIGLAAFIDKAGTGPSANLAKRGGLHGGWESAIVRVHSDGKVTIFSGSHSHGQGHEITFCQIAADRLGLPIEDLRLVEGDTDRTRSERDLGRALDFGCGDGGLPRRWQGRDKARRLRRATLECAEGDVDYGRGTSQCGAPTGRLHSPTWPTSPITARCCRRAARPASKSPSSTIRLTPTTRRPSTLPW